MKFLLPLVVLGIVFHAGLLQANQPSKYTVGQEAYVINDHYLVGTDCGSPNGVSIATHVGVGSLVTILADHRTSVEQYTDDSAIRVRVENNTENSVIAAPSGCEGWALYDYLDGDSN